MVDMTDLKSVEQKRSCGFDSHLWYGVTIWKQMTGQTLSMKKTKHYDKGSEKTV